MTTAKAWTPNEGRHHRACTGEADRGWQQHEVIGGIGPVPVGMLPAKCHRISCSWLSGTGPRTSGCPRSRLAISRDLA